MGVEARYKCKNCGNEFEASVGGGWFFELYRCVKCDRTKQVNAKQKDSAKQYPADSIEQFRPHFKSEKDYEVGVCKSCGGELRDDLMPMCRKCKSRDVEEIEVLVYYD